MFRKVLFALVVGLCCAGGISAKVIKTPGYDFRKSGVLKITEVERTKDATRLTFMAKYKPKWWIRLDPTDVEISFPGDSAVVKPIALDADFTYGEKYFMPESGETVFTVTYPPLPKSVKKIDTGAATDWAIFGIDVAGKGKKADKNARTVTVKPYRPIETIFEADTITLSGFIKGYDPQRSGIKVMELVVYDEAIGRTTPVAIPIKADGSFNRRFLLPMAQKTYLIVNPNERRWVDVYLEPHNDLEIMIDYDKLLECVATDHSADEAITFGGSLGEINAELAAAPEFIGNIAWEIDESVPVNEATHKIVDHHAGIANAYEKYIADANVSDKAAAILRSSALAERITDLLDYADYGRIERLLPADFYTEIIAEACRADSTLLAAGSHFLLNRLGFAHILPESCMDVDMSKLHKLMDYLSENGIELDDNDMASIGKFIDIKSSDSIQNCTYNGAISTIMLLRDVASRAGRQPEVDEVMNNPDYRVFSPKAETNREFIQRLCGSEELPLIWQFAVVARECSDPESLLAEMITKYGVDHKYLIERVTEAAKPKGGAWKLPHSEAGYLMSALIAPYQGKYLLVDFWDLYCGPCRAGIEGNKERREHHRGNPGFAFLFIASETGSPIDGYNAYVEKNLKGENVMRLPEDKMILLRELFGFNGIPRYVLFNPAGEVVNSNYDLDNFWELLEEEGIIDGGD